MKKILQGPQISNQKWLTVSCKLPHGIRLVMFRVFTLF